MADDLTTYSLAEAATMICGKDPGMKDPVLWVCRKIAGGQFGAIKVGQTYRMTAANIRDALESPCGAAQDPSLPARSDADLGSAPTTVRTRQEHQVRIRPDPGPHA
jgi:hypothetical protein